MKRLIITEVPYVGDLILLGKPTVFKAYLFTDEQTNLKEAKLSSVHNLSKEDLEFIKSNQGKLYKIPGIFMNQEDIVMP